MTQFREEAAKLRVDHWLASRVESAERSSRVTQPSGASSSSAPAVASSSLAAAEQFRSNEVPDQGVKRVGWPPQVEDTIETGSERIEVGRPRFEKTTRVHDGGPGRRW